MKFTVHTDMHFYVHLLIYLLSAWCFSAVVFDSTTVDSFDQSFNGAGCDSAIGGHDEVFSCLPPGQLVTLKSELMRATSWHKLKGDSEISEVAYFGEDTFYKRKAIWVGKNAFSEFLGCDYSEQHTNF